MAQTYPKPILTFFLTFHKSSIYNIKGHSSRMKKGTDDVLKIKDLLIGLEHFETKLMSA
jgi:hypothetical protein